MSHHRYAYLVDHYPAAHVEPMRLDGFGNHRHESAPSVTVRVILGADVIDCGRGVTATAEITHRYIDGRGWVPIGGYSYMCRADGRELTDRMRDMCRAACAALLPPAPTRADVERLARDAADRERERIYSAYMGAMDKVAVDLATVTESLNVGRIAHAETCRANVGTV